MITRIEAYRYRCFRSLNVRMRPFQVLVGPNGAGKTTLLDIPILLGEMLKSRSIESALQGVTETHVRPRTDLARDLLFNRSGDSFSLAVEAEIPPQITSQLVEKTRTAWPSKTAERYGKKPEHWPSTVRYELVFELFNEALQIKEESVVLLPRDDKSTPRRTGTIVAEGGRRYLSQAFSIIPVIERRYGDPVVFTPEMERKPLPTFKFQPTEPAFANLFSDASMFGASLSLRDLLMTSACPYQPDLAILRRAQPPVSKPELEPNGSSLPWLVQQLSEKDLRSFERWIRMVRLALPEVRNVEAVVREDDKHGYLRVIYDNDRQVPASDLSDGTLAILAATILPYLSETRQLIVHEEPESGSFQFSPGMDLLRDTSGRDPGIWRRAHELLKTKRTTHRHAIIILDNAWEGTPGPAQIEADISLNMEHSGWPPDRRWFPAEEP